MSFNPETANLNDWLARLESLHPTEIDLGLARISQVAERLNCLRPAPLVIMVGGTNGKGTTSTLISALLQAQGLKVGAYNSPHIHRYNERVTINGVEATDEQLCASFQKVEAARQEVSLTYFEFGTLAAFSYFAQQNLDACVLEIGLGGRLDAVNIVDADISVVTSLGLDHQAFLGNTIEQIAYEKMSIARADKWLVCGQANPPATAKETVDKIGGLWCCQGEDFAIQTNEQGLLVNFKQNSESQTWQLATANIPTPNVATALQALALLNRLPSLEVCQQTIAKLSVRGRLQSFQHGELTITLDVAHNEQAAAYIGQKLGQVDGIILGMLADKEPEKVVPVLPNTQQWFLVGLDCHRGTSAQQLAQRVPLSAEKVTLFENVAAAMQQLPTSGHWLICGSFYTVEAALQVIEQESAWKSS